MTKACQRLSVSRRVHPEPLSGLSERQAAHLRLHLRMSRHVAPLHRVQAVLAPAPHVPRRVLLRLDYHVIAVESAQARVEAHEEGHQDWDGRCRETVG